MRIYPISQKKILKDTIDLFAHMQPWSTPTVSTINIVGFMRSYHKVQSPNISLSQKGKPSTFKESKLHHGFLTLWGIPGRCSRRPKNMHCILQCKYVFFISQKLALFLQQVQPDSRFYSEADWPHNLLAQQKKIKPKLLKMQTRILRIFIL